MTLVGKLESTRAPIEERRSGNVYLKANEFLSQNR